MAGSFVIRGFLAAERKLQAHEIGWLDDANEWDLHTLDGRGSFVVGPFAAFERGLDAEELYTLAHMEDGVWAVDMDLLPARGTVELSTAPTNPRNLLTAPKLARRHEHNMRRDRGR